MYVLAINGSPNKNGDTAFLLNETLDILKRHGVGIEIFHISSLLKECKTPFCNACSNPCSGVCYANTPIEELFEKMKKADVILIGSPTYFGSVSAQLKAFFDKTRRLRMQKAYVGKKVMAFSVGASKYGGQEQTLNAIHQLALVQGMTILGDGDLDTDPGHHGVCGQRPVCEDQFAMARIKVAANRILMELKR